MTTAGHGLSSLILLPVLGCLACLLFGRTLTAARIIVGSGGLFLAALSWILMGAFGHLYPYPSVDLAWIPSWGARIQLAADPLGLSLAGLSALLVAFAAFEKRGLLEASPRGASAALFLLLTALNGVFLARDLLLFFFFWELTLIPMLILIGRWGGERRLYAAKLFFLFTMAGSALMLAGIVGLGLEQASGGGGAGFSLDQLARLGLDPAKQAFFFWCFFIAFAVKVPVFPLHSWLPIAHVEAPTVGSMLLAGVLLKMGGFGFIRILLPLFPDAAAHFGPLAAALGCAGVVYGSLAALGQGDMKRLVALSSVGHLGVATAALFAGTPQAIEGGAFILISHGVASAGLFYMVGLVYGRYHTREMARLGGVAKALPDLAAAGFILVLAGIGAPLTCGFVGEFLAILGTYTRSPLVSAVLCSGVVLSAVYFLSAYQKVFLGTSRGDAHHVESLSWSERTPLFALAALSLILGLWPEAVLGPIRASLLALGSQVLP